MLLTHNNQLQNGVLCLEPNYNKKYNVAEGAFMACDFSPSQKWNFIESAGMKGHGKIVHEATGKCLSFHKPRTKTATSDKYKNVRMLAFLSGVVGDIGLKIEAPILSPCETKPGSEIYDDQIWAMDMPAKL